MARNFGTLCLLICLTGATFAQPSDVREKESSMGIYRQARSVVPDDIEELLHPGVKRAFLHTHGDKKGDDGDLRGFSKKMNSKKNDGYEHYDSYHKKNANKYGFEIYSKFGKLDKAEVDTASEDEKQSRDKEESHEDGSSLTEERK